LYKTNNIADSIASREHLHTFVIVIKMYVFLSYMSWLHTHTDEPKLQLSILSKIIYCLLIL